VALEPDLSAKRGAGAEAQLKHLVAENLGREAKP